MAMRITTDSHTDHALTPEHLEYILRRFGEREGFFIETVELPPQLASLPCGLYGPSMGDDPISDADVAMVTRGTRPNPSRLVYRAPRPSRQMTVIAGPHEGETILYTAFGGPAAPREPGDPSLEGDALAESRAFWATHALSAG